VIDINNEFASTLGEPRAKSATVRTSEHWLAKERMCWCEDVSKVPDRWSFYDK